MSRKLVAEPAPPSTGWRPVVGVEALGFVGKGAQRWLDLGIIRLQPSEFMKPAIVLVLARFFELLPVGDIRKWRAIWPAALLIGVPALLILVQPDLGTCIMVMLCGVTVMFLAVVFGKNVAESSIGHWFVLSHHQVTIAMALYTIAASVLPVWMLLTPRAYLSTFMKIGTIILLASGQAKREAVKRLRGGDIDAAGIEVVRSPVADTQHRHTPRRPGLAAQLDRRARPGRGRTPRGPVGRQRRSGRRWSRSSGRW